MDELIDGGERDHWMEWDMELREGSRPRPFMICPGFRSSIPSPATASASVSSISFRGDRPGSNLTCVRAEDHAPLACLQHRLSELDEGVRILIDT